MSKSKKLPPTPPPSTVDPVEVFCHGESFRTSALRLFDEFQATPDRSYVFPYFVLLAFAVELHIKCLHYEMRKPPDNIHGIKKLFEALDPACKLQIQSHFDAFVAASPAPKLQRTHPFFSGIKLDLAATLMRCDVVFTKFRYQFENPQWTKDNEGFSGPEGLSSLSNAVLQFIIEKHPDWMMIYENARIMRVETLQ